MNSQNRASVWLVGMVLFALLTCKALDVWEARGDAKYRAPTGQGAE